MNMIGKAKVFYDGIELKGCNNISVKTSLLSRLIDKIKLKRMMRFRVIKGKIKNKVSLNNLEAWDRIKVKAYKNKSLRNYKKLNINIEILKEFVNNNSIIGNLNG